MHPELPDHIAPLARPDQLAMGEAPRMQRAVNLSCQNLMNLNSCGQSGARSQSCQTKLLIALRSSGLRQNSPAVVSP